MTNANDSIYEPTEADIRLCAEQAKDRDILRAVWKSAVREETVASEELQELRAACVEGTQTLCALSLSVARCLEASKVAQAAFEKWADFYLSKGVEQE